MVALSPDIKKEEIQKGLDSGLVLGVSLLVRARGKM
jgi:hypothetical protein